MPSGRDYIGAVKKASTWGTAVACGAGNGILVTSDSFMRDREKLADDSAGQPFSRHVDDGQIKLEGSLDSYLRYRGGELPLALVMGTAGSPAQQGATTAYLHTLTLADDCAGLFATYAADRGGSKIFEVPSVKFTEFTINGEAGQPLTISFNGQGDTLNRNTTSGTNTTTTIANVTVPDYGKRVLMSQGVFWLNAQSGAALQSSDAVKPSKFSLSLKRPHVADYVAGSDSILEPSADGMPEVMLSLEFPEYTSTLETLIDSLLAGTAQKMLATFTGALIADTYYNQFIIELPDLVPRDPKGLDIKSASRIGPVQMEFIAKAPLSGSAPTGMTATKPAMIKIMNTLATNILA